MTNKNIKGRNYKYVMNNNNSDTKLEFKPIQLK